MGLRGPAPRPTALRILDGNPSKEPINLAEPKPRVTRMRCPSWLMPEAKKEWRRIVPELRRLKLLTMVDRSGLMGYCQSFARWKQAEEVLTTEGLIFKSETTGYVQQRPEVSISQKQLALMRAFLHEFGLTPSARTRLVAPATGEDSLDSVLN